MSEDFGKCPCVECGKDKFTSRCLGCLSDYCYQHLRNHRDELSRQLDHIELSRDLFQQLLNERISSSDKYSLMKQIEQWEEDSMEIIHQTAQQWKKILVEQTNEYFHQINFSLVELTRQLRKLRQQNDFNEIDLANFQEKLKKLQKQFQQSPNIHIQQHPTSFINNISLLTSFGKFVPSLNITNNTKWNKCGITIGGDKKELRSPYGISIDDDFQRIYVADCENHRIIECKYGSNHGQVILDGNDENIQLNYPTDVLLDKINDSLLVSDYQHSRVVRCDREDYSKVETIISNITCWGLAMDLNGDIYVSDWKNNEVKRWKIGDYDGTVVAGGHGEGNQIDQLHFPTYLFIDQESSLYISDTLNHRVMKWMKGSKEGLVVAGGHGQGSSLKQLSHPRGILVDHLGNVYIADSGNHRVVRWLKDAQQGSIIVGGKGKGKLPDQFNSLKGIAFDRHGNLFVADKDNHRVQKFSVSYD